MERQVQIYSSFVAAVVGVCLFAWVLLRGARSTPTRLMAALVGSLAELQGFEFLWLRHGTPAYVHLEFLGVVLAPCFTFHYATSLAGSGHVRRWAAATAYAIGFLFLVVAIGGLWNRRLSDFFWEPKYHYNTLYVCIYFVFVTWALVELARCRIKDTDSRTRSLFTYPLLAGLVAMPTGFLELTSELGWNPPKIASFGCMIASVTIATGVVRNRSVYDAFALLRKDAASVLRANVQGILYVEPDGGLLFCNRLARSLLGLEKEPRTLAEAGLEIPADGRAIVRRGDRILEIRAVRSAEVIPAGRCSLILQDKTREFELLQQLASKETLASLGQAAATLAHEIRNPLTAIKSSLDCAAQDLAEGKTPERRHMELSQTEVRRLNDLLERSLQLSRPLELRPEACDVGGLVARMAERMPPGETRVRTEVEPGLPRVQADPDLLAQLFANLLKNAAEASREVRVTAGRRDGRLTVAVFSARARLSDEILPRLFEPFVTTKAGGTGLGLAVCRKIALAHGATVTGRNVEGGVTFEVDFPL